MSDKQLEGPAGLSEAAGLEKEWVQKGEDCKSNAYPREIEIILSLLFQTYQRALTSQGFQ